MPKIPDPNEFRGGTPQGSKNAASINTSEYASSIRRAAATRTAAGEQTSRAIGAVGDAVISAARKQQQELDRAKILDGENKLLDVVTDITLKAQTVKEGGVLDPGYMKAHLSEYDLRAKEVYKGMNNPEQRRQYNLIANRARHTLGRSIMTHAAQESERFQSTVYGAGKQKRAALAASQINNPLLLNEVADGNEVAAGERALALGLPSGSDAFNEFVRKEMGDFHTTVVDSYLAARQGRNAQEYLEATKEHMAPEQYKVLAGKTRHMADFEAGSEVGNAAFAMQESGAKATDVQKYLTEQTKGNPDAFSAAKAVLLELDQARKIDIQNTTGGIISDFADAPNQASAYTQIITSPEFLDLPLSEQGKLKEHMQDRINSGIRMDRAAQNAEKNKWNTDEVRSKFKDVINDPDLAKRWLTAKQINSLEPDIGPDNVRRIADEWQRQRQGIKKFNIDKDLIFAAMPEDLLKTKNKDAKNAFLGLIESNLSDWKDSHPGDTPNLDDQKKIVRSALATYQKPGILFGTNEKPLYTAPADEREKLRLETRSAWEAAMQREAQAQTPPRLLTPEQLESGWQKKQAAAGKK